ncbi:phosphate ABC transporter permease PstA [Oceanibacterium hippocampi]|uniref:Phosphate transport system permease protein PstA n=1 Tax=Oceanibacterium hippocampi TaxID=745714 RepID=A0A1Y5SBG9_9PROT|nr:phosphate ABC transporter permease PstA [Oceanibacterium hippocampi]SLN36919.1 Phosphate transport system permease protein PstA [Oceanibacterium hippocampi]
MTDQAINESGSESVRSSTVSDDAFRGRLKRRHAADRRFRLIGLGAILVALTMLGIILVSIVGKGYTAFVATEIMLTVDLDRSVIDPKGTGDPAVIGAASYGKLIRDAMMAAFPEVKERRKLRSLFGLVSGEASHEIRQYVLDNPDAIGTRQAFWFPADDNIDMLVKGHIDRKSAEGDRKVSNDEIAWVEQLEASGAVRTVFNSRFFSSGDSREPEIAGVWGAVVGSFFMLVVTLLLSFPIAVMTAVYLEEFAPKNRWTDLIEVNINNLAAVPSIVFGLLGLAVFLNVMHLPRSAPIVGGLTLALMTLPTIVIAARAALGAVPPSIRQAALGMGASPMQTVLHHVLPLAMPGILTGTILGMARALGETAPLLMIGMVAFIVDIPSGVMDPATALPVQIYLWADSPERAFVEKTSGAIMVLLGFLIFMNAIAVLLRKRFERRW